jgi:DHA2 family methylenomycin A resistance protein-like MFS transporter
MSWILDVTVINVAVPVIGRELSASLPGVRWITDGTPWSSPGPC